MNYRDIEKMNLITELFNHLEQTLGARLVSKGEWSSERSTASEDLQSRLISYDTNIPNIKVQHIEFRYPNRPEWGTSVRRVINRVSQWDRVLK